MLFENRSGNRRMTGAPVIEREYDESLRDGFLENPKRILCLLCPLVDFRFQWKQIENHMRIKTVAEIIRMIDVVTAQVGIGFLF